MTKTAASTENYTPNLKTVYSNQVIPHLKERFGLKNTMAAPRLEKIVVGMGLSDARDDIKVVDRSVEELAAITGQKPLITRAKKSISNFKLRKGMPIGVKVTLRGSRMYEFFERLITMAIPRIRDFRGVEPNGFDGNGNFNLGLTEHHIFLEVDLEKSDKARGLNITIVTSSRKDEEAKELLTALGFPFRKEITKGSKG